MSEPPPTLSLAEIARRLDCAGVTWAVFAGAAASVYGATRPLTDVDILVPAADADRITALVPEAEVLRRDDGSVRGVQLPGIDILVGLSLMDLDAKMAERLTRHTIAGVRVPVIPPEDNILLKAISGRGPEVGKHDWEEVEAMMDHLPALDWEYLRWRAGACARPQQAQQALQRLLKKRR
jgi:hypothetical protein